MSATASPRPTTEAAPVRLGIVTLPVTLLDLPTDELTAMARGVRGASTGTRVTYSPKVFVPLTRLCRDRCGYCTFATAPHHIASPYLSPDEVVAVASAGAEAGCHEALFTLGEAPEDRYVEAREWLAAHGYASTVDYLVAMAGRVLEETGLLPHANAGAVSREDLARLRAVAPSQGMMIESLRPDLAAHRGAPDKTPERRLATLEAAGELGIPFTTGILVGIGETRGRPAGRPGGDRRIARRHGHVQEVIVQNFLPKPGTAMRDHPPCPPEDHVRAIALARLVLPADVHVQAPPNLSDLDRLGDLLDAGIDDWGGVSPVTIDHVNPERPWPAVDTLRVATEARGLTLAPRLTVYPEFAADPDRWLDAATRFPVLDRSDARVAWAATTPGRPGPSGTRPPRTSAPVPRSSRSAAAPPPGTPAPTPPVHAADPIRSSRRRARGPLTNRGRGAPRCSTASGPGRRSARPRSSRCSGPAGRRSPRSPSWPTTCAAQAVGRHRHLRRQPQHQLHQRVHLQVHVLRVLQGPAVAEPARRAVPAVPRRHRRTRRRGRRARRHRGVPARRHPPAPSTATSTSTSCGR